MALPLVLVGGWAMPCALVADCVPAGRECHWLQPEQLAEPVPDSVEQGLDWWLPGMPERAVWIGWSLGGQVAMAASQWAPERVAGVITLCSSPRFVSGPGWEEGVTATQFARFRRRLARSPQAALAYFCSLMLHGSSTEQEDRARLRARQWPQPAEAWCLGTTLGWLEELDQRELWRQPVVPSYHLFGSQDALISASVASVMELSTHRRYQVSGMAHWPGGGFAAQVLEPLGDWLNQVG